MIQIIKATKENLDQLVPLFDQYRVFYRQPSDLSKAKDFLSNRFEHNESIIFLAFYNEEPAGFTQLYPMFSSVSMQRSFVLNDLFVHPNYRKNMIGAKLLERAKEYCIEKNAKGLTLETSTDNPAQKLYEKLGWQKDIDCFHYFWSSSE